METIKMIEILVAALAVIVPIIVTAVFVGHDLLPELSALGKRDRRRSQRLNKDAMSNWLRHAG
jgi:hypothetical protein